MCLFALLLLLLLLLYCYYYYYSSSSSSYYYYYYYYYYYCYCCTTLLTNNTLVTSRTQKIAATPGLHLASRGLAVPPRPTHTATLLCARRITGAVPNSASRRC